MSVSVWVQAHPSRAELHKRLSEALFPMACNLSMHSSDPPNPWAGYELAVRRAVNESTALHLLVLQDDAIPCKDFPSELLNAIQDRPNDVLSLWVGALRCKTTTEYRKAMIARQRWSPIYFSDIHHCVAIVWPRGLALSFLEWAATSRLPGEDRPQQSDDAIFGAWARRTHNQVWAHVPSLVEHDDDIESTIGRPRGDRGRRAISFAGS